LVHLLFDKRHDLIVAAEFSDRKSLHKSLGHQFHDVVVIPQVFVVALAGLQARGGNTVHDIAAESQETRHLADQTLGELSDRAEVHRAVAKEGVVADPEILVLVAGAGYNLVLGGGFCG
jgi:hypothetical protein